MSERKLLITGASVPGKLHLYEQGGLLGINNHDALIWDWWTPDSGIAVVADGLGSDLPKDFGNRPPYSIHRRRRSEIGSNIGVHLLLKHCTLYQAALQNQLREALRVGAKLPVELPALKRIREDFLSEIRVMANLLRSAGHSFTDTIQRMFLFPVQVALVFPDVAAVFGTGDGVYAVNGELTVLQPEEGNIPPCVCYNMIDAVEFLARPELLQFRVRNLCPGGELDSLLLGSDGAEEVNDVANQKLPGMEEAAGNLSQFWTNEWYWQNRMRIQGRLNLFQGSSVTLEQGEIHRHEPLLGDDTSIVLMKLVQA